jgi:hypothetical protein
MPTRTEIVVYMHSFIEYTGIDESDFHGLKLSLAVLGIISVSTAAHSVWFMEAYRDEVSNVTLQDDELQSRCVAGQELLTRSVTLRCCSNSALANCRMSFRAPSSGMFAVLRTISRHKASARCRWMN